MAITKDSHPYLLAKQEWEEMVGPLKTRLINANRIIALLSILTVTLAIGLVLTKKKETVIPYVAVIDRHGQLLTVATATKASGTLDGVKVDQLQHWVWESRTVLSEREAQLSLVLDVMRKTTDEPARATAYMRNWYQHNSPYERAKTGYVSVQITSTLARSDDTYELEWAETTHAADGTTPVTENWKGVFRVVMATPTAEERDWNPVGFYVSEVNWSRKV